MQDFFHKKQAFDYFVGAKVVPNEREKKWIRIAQSVSRKIACIPGVRMIAICNSLSMYATHQNSDIDLFVVTAPDRMWLVRIFSNIVVRLMGLRRPNLHKQDGTIAGKICLSFFCTTNALDFSKIAIEDDVYLFFWMRYLKVVIDHGSTYETFAKTNTIEPSNDTMKYLLNTKSPCYDHWGLWGWIDWVLKKIFLPRTRRSYTQLGCPDGVVIDEYMLKFHDQDKRREIRDTLL